MASFGQMFRWDKFLETIRESRVNDFLSLVNELVDYDDYNSTYEQVILDMIFEQCTETNRSIFIAFYKMRKSSFDKIMLSIVKHDKLFLLKNKYVQTNPISLFIKNKEICITAVKYDNLAMLQWLVDRSYVLDREVMYSSIQYNRMRILQWLVNHSFVLDGVCCSLAAKHGHFSILKWLRSQSPDGTEDSKHRPDELGDSKHRPPCPWDHWTSWYAIVNKHIDVFRWAVANGCPIKAEVFNNVIGSDDFETFQWLCSMHPEFMNCDLLWDTLIPFKRFHFASWLLEQGCPWQSVNVPESTFEIAEFIRDHSDPWVLFFFHWVLSRNCPFDRTKFDRNTEIRLVRALECFQYYKASRWLEQRYPAYFTDVKRGWLTAIDQHLGRNPLPCELNALIKDYI